MRQDTPEILQIQNLIDEFEKASGALGRLPISELGLPPADALFGQWLKQLERQRRHSTQKYTIMLLGEYNVGKSTLLNALLMLPSHQRLPTDDRPTNARPIRLTYMREGDSEARVITDDGKETDTTWDEAIREATTRAGGADASLSLREVQLFLDNPLLQQADILDMPGTGTAWYQTHTDITREYIANAEMVIWVIGADEPSATGWADVNLALKGGAPITVVYNAWGFLDAQKDVCVNINQDDIERSVQKNFLAGAKVNGSFRVYAGKYVEALKGGVEPSPEWGLEALRKHLMDKYLGEFLNRAEARRDRVLRGLAAISREAHGEVTRLQEMWSAALEGQGLEGSTISAKLHSMHELERQIRAKVRRQAGDYAQAILSHIARSGEDFINDHIRIGNFDLLKSAVQGTGQAYLEQTLSDIFRNDYLKLDQEQNWFHREIGEFVSESWIVIEAEWRRFLDEISFDEWRPTNSVAPPDIPFERIRRAAMEGVKSLVARLVTTGTVIGILLLIPGVQIVAALTFILSAITAALMLGDPFETQRKNAIARFRNEMSNQHDGFRKNLVDLVMSNNGKLLESFSQSVAQQRGAMEAKTKALNDGIVALNELLGSLDDNTQEGSADGDR